MKALLISYTMDIPYDINGYSGYHTSPKQVYKFEGIPDGGGRVWLEIERNLSSGPLLPLDPDCEYEIEIKITAKPKPRNTVVFL